MVRSEVRPSSRSRSGPSGPRSTTAERSGAHTSAVTRSCTTRCATSAASSSLSAACSWSTSAGSVTSPAPSAYHRCWRTRSRSSSIRRASGVRGAGFAVCSTRSSVRSVATCSSVGGRTGLTRPTRVRARSDHSKTIAGSPCSRASLMPCLARSRPCPTRVLCRSRLPNEDCQVCRSARPARTWSRACRESPRAWASSARTSRQSSRVVTGVETSTRTGVQPLLRVVELPADAR